MYYAAPYLITIGRVLMAIMFIQAGINKIFGYAGAQGYMEAAGVAWRSAAARDPGRGGRRALRAARPVHPLVWRCCSPASVCSPRSCSTFIPATRCR